MRFSEAMDGQIKVRVSLSEKQTLAEAARERGLTLSELVLQGADFVIRRAA